mgnify:CR=1 FL=1
MIKPDYTVVFTTTLSIDDGLLNSLKELLEDESLSKQTLCDDYDIIGWLYDNNDILGAMLIQHQWNIITIRRIQTYDVYDERPFVVHLLSTITARIDCIEFIIVDDAQRSRISKIRVDKVSLFYERFVNDNNETILQVDLHEEELQANTKEGEELQANTKEGELQANPKEGEELHSNQQDITNYDSDESTIQDAQKREGQYQSELEVIPVVKKKRGRPKSVSTMDVSTTNISLESAKTEDANRRSERKRKRTK